MEVISIKDKKFAISIPEQDILKEVERIGQQISRDKAGKDVLFVCVLNGAFMFASDLLKNVSIPCEVSFIRLASYEGMSSSGAVKEVLGLTQSLKGKSVVVVEDIIDSGLTMQHLLEVLKEKGAEELSVASLLVKHENIQVPVQIDYECISIPNDFIVGYGLDYDGYGRNLRDIYTVVQD